MIQISCHTEHSIVSVIPEGRLDTVNSTEFDRVVNPLAEKEKFLIIDLSRCDYLSSTGIRSFMKTKKKLMAKGGDLLLSGLSGEVFQIIEMAGLNHLFGIFHTVNEARKAIEKQDRSDSNCFDVVDDDISCHFQLISDISDNAQLWQGKGIAGYNELGFSVGCGFSAELVGETATNEGLFVTTGNCAGFIPYDTSMYSDFRIPRKPAEAGIYVVGAFSFNGQPSYQVTVNSSGPVRFSQLQKVISDTVHEANPNDSLVLMCVIFNQDTESPSFLVTGQVDTDMVQRFGLTCNGALSFKIGVDKMEALLGGAIFKLEEVVPFSSGNSLKSFACEALTLDNIEVVEPLDLSAMLYNLVAWVFVATGFTSAGKSRLNIEANVEPAFEPHVEFLIRRLYHDSSMIVVNPLHGGYSAQTFQVDSFDLEGRKLRPTVLKIANRDMITRESERCQKYSLPYILNNSAMVLGAEFFGDTGALRYNFVGIGGEQTQLKWLKYYFETWDIEQLEPLFDKIFLQILKPWYGQPVREPIYPFKDHDPTLTFFPHIGTMAEQLFNISSDEEYMVLEETGQKLVNPFWFLKHEYKKRYSQGMEYYTSICHGDLNLQNILLDQSMNVYLIDFSETRPRSVVSDFARLESIFMIEYLSENSAGGMKNLIEFFTRFYQVERLGVIPVNYSENIGDEVLERSMALTGKMREYAFISSLQNQMIAPYYLAMLEWVLPIVCYSSATMIQKRMSVVIAALLCEKVRQLL